MLEIHEADDLQQALNANTSWSNVLVQNLDLTPWIEQLLQQSIAGIVILGAGMSEPDAGRLVSAGALVFPALPQLPYRPYRTRLYTAEELYRGFDPAKSGSYQHSPDARIYEHWQRAGAEAPRTVLEALAQRLHDHSIREAKAKFLSGRTKVVAFMGGHSLLRTDPAFRDVAVMARTLTRRGYTVVSGGGPGAMEATNLGAFVANADDAVLDVALRKLSVAPKYDHPQWLSAAFDVLSLDVQPAQSLGVPTWLYGHEPPNPFATHIAKLFQNSIREDALVTMATRGIIFAPGSAGTVQELFQDAAQNHYGTAKGLASPMVLLGSSYWTETLPVWPLLNQLAAGRPYSQLLHLGDEPAALLDWLEAHPPVQLDP